MRYVRPLLIALLALAALSWQGHDASATHDGTGEHIDQVSIDMYDDGGRNGRPTAGDRNFDGVPDAEGYDTADPGDSPGDCGNFVDDDRADTDGDTVPGPGGLDGIADDGCRATLTPQETCAEIYDDGFRDGHEEPVVSGQDRLSFSITVGAHPGPGGGVPPSRPLAAWQYFLNWDTDVIDVDVHNPYFLILVSGGAQPFTIVEGPLPDISSPFPAAVSDAGPGDIGAGVLARVIIEGNAAGIAKLSLSNVQLFDISGNPIPVDAINGAQVNVSKDGPDAGTTIGDSPGELFPCSSVDQVSIDMGPPGVANGVERNGKPAVGDRSGDGIVDAEGYNTPDPGDTPGACGNGIDDDQADTDGDTVPGPGGFDGVADDGCVVTLSQRETCAEIIDDDVLNADEDQLTSGQDRLRLDVTVGAQPGPGGGIPATRLMKAWQYSLRWTPDLIDVDLHSEKFLILAAGGQQPVTVVTAPTPLQNPPFTAAVSDAGPKESGPGVLARVTIEGREPGVADLTLSDVTITDYISHTIPIDALNSARIAVSKDGPDEGTSIGDSPGERFRCSGPEYPDDDSDGVYDVDEQACGSNPLNSTLRPERLDGPFAGVDDDGDGSTDEPLPPSREGFDCDGDGWIGRWEMDVFGVVGTSKDQDPCGNDGWPSDLIGIDNSLTIADIRSFLAPIRMDGSFNKFSHPVPDDEDPSVGRWDLRQPTNGVIDIADLNRLNPGVNTNMARPPMFGGQPAFFTNLGQCPWPP